MIVLVDIGNTHTKYCFYDGDDQKLTYQYINSTDITPQWLATHWLQCKRIILASVQQASLVSVIQKWADNSGCIFQQVCSDKAAFGIENGYVLSSQLGVDRWLAMIGAHELYPNKNLVIVDAGTATTIDVLLANGKHIGGWIIPGVDMMQSSLMANTAQVSQQVAKSNEYSKERSQDKTLACANNTFDNVFRGSWLATVGAINIAVAEVNKGEWQLDYIILTGGNAERLAPQVFRHHKETSCQVNNDLIFHGLKKFI